MREQTDNDGKDWRERMLRDESIEEISDGRFYGPNDMVKADTGDCRGCSLCCHGMEDTLLLEPPDIYRFRKEIGFSFEMLLEKAAELGMADGLILPHLRMKADEACAFLDENGRCSVHKARPAYCRMFPLGRFYRGDDFVYILQVHQCEHPRTKVKVRKWIDLPDLSAYEDFARSWHAFLTLARRIASEDDSMRKSVCMVILKRFYQFPWDTDRDFYEQFGEQLAAAKRDLGMAG